jgi:hypothetical protein
MGKGVQSLGLAGYSKIRLRENGKLVGDSDWVKNTITDYGLDEGLGQLLTGGAGSKRVAAVALGTGTAPATDATALNGIIEDNTDGRDSPTLATVTTSDGSGVTARFYGTFASSESRFSTTHAIRNIGLYASTTTNTGTVFAGATYTISTLNTNQDVEYTYEWRIATTT